VLALAPTAKSQQAYGSVTGLVTDAGTKLPVSDLRVMIVGTTIGTSTNAEGRYTLARVPAGQVSIRAIRVGYQQQVKPVDITAGQSATLDFVMAQAAVQLTEIVTTATGEQRRVELGNAIATIANVPQKVEQTATNNIADLLTAKAPGIVVLPAAMTGAAPVVRIRGIGSLATTGSGITNDPIYIIDGVRMNSGTLNLGTGGTRASLLNDLDPNEIQDIEVVKGPSAATLYGTDAANGVVVITTKRGRAGATQWTWFGEQGLVQDNNKYPASYALWGHKSGTTTLQRCTLVSQSQGTCVVDSLTSFNVLTNPSSTPFKTGNRNWYGSQVSGGTDRVRFFVSGDIQNEVGPIEMPAFAQATIVDSLKIAMRDEWLHPEAFQSYNLRTNLNASLSPTVDLTMTAGYSNTNQRLPQTDNNINSFIYSARNNPGFNHNGAPGISYSEDRFTG
jgi:TonB-dependent SusC/RagA subfamily outer membrane receptor